MAAFSINYRRYEEMNDIDRAMCVMSRLPHEEICTIENALRAAFGNRLRPRNTTEPTFFEVKFYKKGRIHLYFKD